MEPQRYSSPSKAVNIQETLYQKCVTQISFDVIYKGYTFREDINEAWHSLKSSTSFTVKQTALLLRVCGHNLPLETTSDKLELLKEVWDSFDVLGIEKEVVHYNALLDVYIELEHKFSPKDFLRNLKKKGLVPNLETYRKLIHALSIQGNIGDSQHFLEDMKMHSVSIDEGVFNSLILGYSLQGDYISARGILELMKEKHLLLSSESYVSLAQGYAKRGDYEKVKEVLDECLKQSTRLSTTELLELAYTFAANGHSEHFSGVLNMIPLKKSFPTVSTKVVHRLLHQKLDKEAFLLLEFRDKLGSVSAVQEPIQMFLDHYVRFREPNEVLNMAEIYRKKGWSSISLAYCLKETLIRKDVSHCLNFLHSMRIRGYPIRIHYFYPILLKASQSGNEAVLGILRHLNEHHLRVGREMVKALDRFYDFLPGAEFNDLEKLKSLGLDKKLVAWKILDILLKRQDVDNAIKLVSTCGIAFPGVLLPNSMIDAFRKRENDHEKFVHILYHLIHNLKANRMMKEPQAEISPVEYEMFVIETAKSCSKAFNLCILKEMLNKKIPLSPEAGSFISDWFSCSQIADLVSKLTSADLKFEFDETLLKRLNDLYEVKKDQQGDEDLRQLYIALKKNKNEFDLVKQFEELAKKREFKNVIHLNNVQKVARRLFRFASLRGDALSTERIYKIGVQKNLIKADDYVPCLIAHLVRGRLDDAVRRFHEGLSATKKFKAVGVLIREIKKKNNFIALWDLNISISQICGENFAATKLLVEFAKLGYIQEARTILLSKVRILKPWLSAKSRMLFKKRNVTYFETLERVSRNTSNINKTLLYYYLLKLYKYNQNLEKLLNLYVELERDDAMNENVRSIFFDFFKNWNGAVPEEFENVFQCIKKDCEARKPLKNTETIYHEGNIKTFLTEDVQQSFNNKNELVSNISDDDFRNNNIFKCFCLIHAGKLDEYFKILKEKIVADGRVKAKDYFFCYKLVPHMISNHKYLEKYKELVTMCNSSDLWKKYLNLCLRLGDADEIRVAMKNLSGGTFNRLRFSLEDINFKDCLLVVKSSECHRQLGKEIAIFYFKIINQLVNQNNMNMARKYYKKAKKHKLESFLKGIADKDLLKL